MHLAKKKVVDLNPIGWSTNKSKHFKYLKKSTASVEIVSITMVCRDFESKDLD
jgi:hypothetical protein